MIKSLKSTSHQLADKKNQLTQLSGGKFASGEWETFQNQIPTRKYIC